MTPLQISRSVRSLNRLRRIAQVLTQHGFGYLVARLNLLRYVPGWIVSKHQQEEEVDVGASTVGRRLRLVCSELGPTFIKLAQMLTTRPDLVPEEILAELRLLQDKVPPFDTAEAMRIIERELGRPAGQCFATLGETPVASGSIGQVYRARTLAGADVMVKVRRPGITQVVELDMQLLRWLADSLERLVPEARIYRPGMIVNEFEEVLLRELDFVNEASATTRLGDAFASVEGLRVPRVYWELCGKEVLTQETLPGVNMNGILSGTAPEAAHVDRRLLGRRLAEAYLTQVFDLGVFHADPHPGNLLVEPPATLGLIDFGQVGTLTEELMGQFVVLVYAAVHKETELMVSVLGEIGALGPTTDRRQFQRALRMLLDKYHGLPLRQIDLGCLFHEFSQVVREHGVVMPRELPVLVKAFSMATNIAQQLDPELNVVELLQPKLKQTLARRVSPHRLARGGAVLTYQILTMLRRAPEQIGEVLRRFASGTWEINLKHANLDRLVQELDRSSNRLAFSVVIAAIIVGSSVVVSADPSMSLLGIPVQWFGLTGYLVAGVFGLSLAWAIFRSGRLH
ncbi:MAG TPA: AarF/ABC1/UbiB kinase family protein [Phycisphaerae bacterium]|nr:AarF/ABC1/UbiB kinase family protein [Phycisphaerae bacterium]HNU46424.1 AarF/ABC1/UbiB kinase family protein [Phycisphaerae bacterium]